MSALNVRRADDLPPAPVLPGEMLADTPARCGSHPLYCLLPSAPAVLTAIYSATGTRVRGLPVRL